MFRSALIFLCLLLVSGCSKETGTAIGSVMFDLPEPEGYVTAAFFADDGKVIYALFLNDETQKTSVKWYCSTTSADKSFHEPITIRGESGKETDVDMVKWDHGSSKIVIMDKLYQLADGEVFLATITDQGIQVEQLNHRFEDTGCSFMKMMNIGGEMIIELSKDNDRVHQFTGGSETKIRWSPE